jgi:signal transduction histidine kinase
MLIKIALILSVVLQFIAAIIALTLVKRTRTNVAWWLISIGFLLMAFRRLFEVLTVFDSSSKLITGMLSSWTGVLISIIMLISLIFIKRIFNVQKQVDELRKQNESKILAAIIETEENERQFFAKELHDGLGPLLSSVKMAISASASNAKEEESRKIIFNAEKLINESINSLKEISNKLSPHILNNFGLLKAVKSFVGKLPLSGQPKINIKSNIENQRFTYTTEVVMYRIISELIVNSLKHADARNIYIDLFIEGKKLRLKYIDDGIGFDMNKPEYERKGMGYSNIISRIRSLNGTVEFFTKPGEGLRVEVEINV